MAQESIDSIMAGPHHRPYSNRLKAGNHLREASAGRECTFTPNLDIDLVGLGWTHLFQNFRTIRGIPLD